MNNSNDVFLISAKAEITRLARLMNKASKAYWALNDRNTTYAQSLYACYLMNKHMIDGIENIVEFYKKGKVMEITNEIPPR